MVHGIIKKCCAEAVQSKGEKIVKKQMENESGGRTYENSSMFLTPFRAAELLTTSPQHDKGFCHLTVWL